MPTVEITPGQMAFWDFIKFLTNYIEGETSKRKHGIKGPFSWEKAPPASRGQGWALLHHGSNSST